MRGFSSASGRNFIKSSRFHTRYMLAVHGSNDEFDPIAPARACSCGYLAPLRSIILRRLSTVSSFAFSTKAQDFTLFLFGSCGYLAPLRSIILRRLSMVSSFAFSIKAQDFTLFFVYSPKAIVTFSLGLTLEIAIPLGSTRYVSSSAEV